MRDFYIAMTVVGLAVAGMASVAEAQTMIGAASAVQRQVTGTYGGRTIPVSAGDSVLQNQTIATGASSLAQLLFNDRTRLSVGATSSVKLDRFVYNPDNSARGAVVNMTRGAFRFATGYSNPGAFQLTTPQATVGIRGTIVDFLAQPGRTTVMLQQGAATVCARGTRNCVNLNIQGQAAIVESGVVQGPVPPGLIAADFIGPCLNGADASFCYARSRPGGGMGIQTPVDPAQGEGRGSYGGGGGARGGNGGSNGGGRGR